MKMKSRKNNAFIILLALTYINAISISAQTKTISNSLGYISINFTDSIIPDSLEVIAISSSIFDEPFENTEHRFIRNNKTFNCQIPLEQDRNLIGLIVGTPHQRYSVGYVELNPNIHLTMEGSFDSNGILNYKKSHATGFNSYTLSPTEDNKSLVVSDILMRFVSYRLGTSIDEPTITPEDYKSWNVINNKLDSLYTAQLNYALNEREIPSAAVGWLENNLKYFFDANWRMNYKERAKRNFNILDDIDNFPLEYYSFLNDIDFSSTFLEHSTVFGPYFLLKKILQQPILAKPIDEMPIKEWQDSISNNIKPIISNPTSIFLNLMAAASYIMQIKDQNKTLSPIQLSNIKNFFDDDLSSVILTRNEQLNQQLNKGTNLLNFSDSNFLLYDFIEKNYQGFSIIVDLWNTWCSPCLNAFRQIETITNLPDKIILLYISDTSSPLKQWRTLSERIGGVQIRIRQADMETLTKLYQLNSFPSYIVFNNKHELLHKQIGFPGLVVFNEWIDQIK